MNCPLASEAVNGELLYLGGSPLNGAALSQIWLHTGAQAQQAGQAAAHRPSAMCQCREHQAPKPAPSVTEGLVRIDDQPLPSAISDYMPLSTCHGLRRSGMASSFILQLHIYICGAVVFSTLSIKCARSSGGGIPHQSFIMWAETESRGTEPCARMHEAGNRPPTELCDCMAPPH